MDCSWLIEDSCNEDEDEESNPEESQAELEARLYSIVHHSDLSQPLPPELAKHYFIQCDDDGKLIVSLNDTLENIKSEEVRKVVNVKDSTPDIENSQDAEIEYFPDNNVIHLPEKSCNSSGRFSNKFRYSDVNLDSNISSKINGNHELSSSKINYSNLNYFKVSQSFLKKKKVKKLKDLVIPPLFQTSENPDWKDSANESFISVSMDTGSEKDIIDQMVSALKEANPKESKGKLYFLARALFLHNRKKYRKNVRRRQTKSNVNKTLDSSLGVENDFSKHKLPESSTKSNENIRNNNINTFIGTVTLNVSPFKPQQSAVDLVDLVSEDEIDHSNKTAQLTTLKWKSLPSYELPAKWTKKMTKFYTKPSVRKMEMDLDSVFEKLKRSSTVNDWKLDPRDEAGVYQRTSTLKGKHRNRRCPNCNQHGHLLHDCPSPRKTPCCFLCGQSHHTAYSCPNKICLKCGVFVTNEAYECSSCYYNTFNYDTPCDICGQVTHRSEICPDLWRSFHATIEGEKKIPQRVKENKRKYCCNCAGKGHFSHQCPFPSCEGEHISSFVANYSASHSENGSTELVLPHHLSHIVESPDANRFLQKLSNSTKAVIDVGEGHQANIVFQIRGTFEQCRKVRREIETFVNNRKRKRQEPFAKRKRRKMR